MQSLFSVEERLALLPSRFNSTAGSTRWLQLKQELEQASACRATRFNGLSSEAEVVTSLEKVPQPPCFSDDKFVT